MKRIKNMIRFIKNTMLSLSDFFFQIAASLNGKSKKESDEPKYLGGGASTEVPQSFHIDRELDKQEIKRGRPKGSRNAKKTKTRR
tara:strand:- start:238 stop:492 length:255 start_codon:yes stop_codon:yes gene_type:complete